MKKLILALVFLVGGVVSADPASVHGMLIFGQKTTYVSHLPMYHSPHDYQVILEVDLGKETGNLTQDMAAHPEEPVYTIEPKRFVLPDMVKGLKAFPAKVYRGHFERGGVAIFTAMVQPKKIVFFKKLNATENAPNALSLLLFGNAQEAYVAHRITARPNFDQIASVSGVSVANEIQIQRNGGLLALTVAQESDKAPVKLEQVLQAPGVMLKVEKEVYLEHGDLEH